MAILNPELHKALLVRFDGDVEVVNEGDAGRIVMQQRGGVRYARLEGTGQEFKVSCPFCEDKRHRLFISYLVGFDIREKGDKVRTYHLMHCHNEGCRTIELYKDIVKLIGNLPEFVPEPCVGKDTRMAADDLPSPNYLINSPKAHPAPVQYLLGRGFDLDELADVYGVRTAACIPGAEHLGQVSLFPCMDGSRTVFWQGRMSYDPPKNSGMPKYYNCRGAKKSEMIYNRTNALKAETVVITEGVLDAIRVGLSGICIYGKHPSDRQTRMMKIVFGRKRGVLMLDPDAEDDAMAWYSRYKGDVLFAKGLYLCRLTDGRDPAEHTREEIDDIVRECVERGPL